MKCARILLLYLLRRRTTSCHSLRSGRRIRAEKITESLFANNKLRGVLIKTKRVTATNLVVLRRKVSVLERCLFRVRCGRWCPIQSHCKSAQCKVGYCAVCEELRQSIPYELR